MKQIRHLLTEPDVIATALKSEERVHTDLRPHRQIVLSSEDLNLHHMLTLAASSGNSLLVEFLLSFGLEHNVSINKMITRDLVHESMESKNNVEIFTELVQIMPEVVSFPMGHAGDPLGFAVGGSNLPDRDTTPLLRYLLENGANPNKVRSPHFDVPGYYLYLASKREGVEKVELLLKHGACISGSGAVQQAAKYGRLKVLEMLVKYGADLNNVFVPDALLGNGCAGTALDVAIRHRQMEVKDWLSQHGATQWTGM
jgi:hypothetical protein